MGFPTRSYAGPDDLARMQALASECWRVEAPFASATPGDMAWWMYQHTNKLHEVRIALIESGDELAAWVWLWLPGALFFQLQPSHREPALFDSVLDWFEHEAGVDAEELAVHAMSTDSAAIENLERRGYRAGADGAMEHLVRSLEHDLPAVSLPAGFAARAVDGENDLARRVDVHRAAFAPSRVTAESYANVMRAHPYRADLDWITVAPDGRFASFCLGWLDAPNGVVEMEPVGTEPGFRRRGLAGAACAGMLRAARGLGAGTAVVYANVDSPAVALYESLAFRVVSRHLVYKRSPREASGPAVRL